MTEKDSLFGKRMRQLRRAKDLTQKQLAVKVETHPEAICRYEKGERTPSVEVAFRIAEALGCSLDDLLKEDVA